MVSYDENTGESAEKAIVVHAENEEEGIAAEYEYLFKKFGLKGKNWNLKRQSLLDFNNRYFDKMEIELSDGSSKSLFFDITEFFGKV